MKRAANFIAFCMALAVFMALGVGHAQVAGPTMEGLFTAEQVSALWSGVLALAATVFGLISTVKRSSPAERSPWLWRGLAVIAGAVLAVTAQLSGVLAPLGLWERGGWAAVLAFGLAGGVGGIFGRDGIKTALGWFGLPAALLGGAQAAPVIVVQGTPAAEPNGFTGLEGVKQ